MIARIGPPIVVTCKVRVTLSDTPSASWHATFQAAVHAKPGIAGATVTIVDRDILFACAGPDIDRVIVELDAWIDVANGTSAAGHPPLLRDPTAPHRDLNWRERRVITEAVDRADSLRDE